MASSRSARLGLGGVVAVVDPAQAVGGDLPAGVLHGGDLGGGAGEGGGDAVDGDGEVAGDEEVAEAPEAGAGAVFVDRFHVPVALAGPGLGAGDLGEEALGGGVAVEDRVLAALLVVEDEADGDLGAAGPVGGGRVAAVALHVPRIAHRCPPSVGLAGSLGHGGREGFQNRGEGAFGDRGWIGGAAGGIVGGIGREDGWPRGM